MSCCYSTSIRSFSCLSPQTGLTQHHAQNDQSASMLHGFWVFTEESAQTLGLQQRQWNVTILTSASQDLGAFGTSFASLEVKQSQECSRMLMGLWYYLGKLIPSSV